MGKPTDAGLLLRRLLPVGLLAVVLALMWISVRRSDVLQRSAVLPLQAWAAAWAGLVCSYLLRAGRLHAEWHGRSALGLRSSLRVTLVHIAALNLLPMRVGEVGYPWLLRSHGQVALGDAVSSLVWMRLQDCLVLAWLGSLAAMAALVSLAQWPLAQALAVACLATLLFLAAVTRLGRWAHLLLGHWKQPVLQNIHLAAQRAAGRARPQTWLWCLANWLVKLATVASLLAALGTLPWLQAWCGALGAEFGAAFPVQPPAGFGTYEAGSALAATLAGPGLWADLLGAALIVHVFAICSAALAGAFATLFLRKPQQSAPLTAHP